ncbi:MAG TPA: hypothetical protein VM934_04410 [Pyrinomonadaceae bacterium]|jgi:hypothetical protein|nr:hypothetical protein [Pyrinomonadaceae bacterium]
MNETFGVSIESPQSGWMSLRLRAGGREFVAVMSHAPYDSLGDLASALASLLKGEDSVTVKWNAEPEEFDFEFASSGDDEIALKVVRFRGHRRVKAGRRVVFSFQGSARALCMAFWRELSTLKERGEIDGFEQNWKRKFPRRELEELTKAIESFGRETVPPSSPL